eukprot:TRINITY_DN3145_c0_g1_i2.p1 TRINITY_DN3145_c0_g1~~TRINITY_DN3145_c0_g1_i2.p1  ORF type:complete len:382 (+),score=46.60 TRINITY_DN3145_c0_g1_i2:33-1148(+)
MYDGDVEETPDMGVLVGAALYCNIHEDRPSAGQQAWLEIESIRSQLQGAGEPEVAGSPPYPSSHPGALKTPAPTAAKRSPIDTAETLRGIIHHTSDVSPEASPLSENDTMLSPDRESSSNEGDVDPWTLLSDQEARSAPPYTTMPSISHPPLPARLSSDHHASTETNKDVVRSGFPPCTILHVPHQEEDPAPPPVTPAWLARRIKPRRKSVSMPPYARSKSETKLSIHNRGGSLDHKLKMPTSKGSGQDLNWAIERTPTNPHNFMMEVAHPRPFPVAAPCAGPPYPGGPYLVNPVACSPIHFAPTPYQPYQLMYVVPASALTAPVPQPTMITLPVLTSALGHHSTGPPGSLGATLSRYNEPHLPHHMMGHQ